MTLWMIGFLFTVGYSGDITIKMTYWKYIGALVVTFALWPLILGFMLCDDNEANDKEDQP